MPKIVTYYELHLPKTKKMHMRNQDCIGEDAIPVTHHDAPAFYISKDWYYRVLGGHPVIKVTIEPALEEDTIAEG